MGRRKGEGRGERYTHHGRPDELAHPGNKV